jgi:endonuclease/exonuclease/phosphatase family metal-dependent hydrolase
MAYAVKQKAILAFQPDVLLLQECSEKHIKESGAPFSHWIGKNPHKGLGVLGFGTSGYALSSSYTPDYPWFLPLQIQEKHLRMLGVWAHVKEKQERYVRITHKAIDYYSTWLEEGVSIVMGDLNSNTIWDGFYPRHSHSALAEKLERLQLTSVYHAQTKERQGSETISTFYLYRHRDKGYHLDYAFVSHRLLENTHLSIPDWSIWLKRSDHLPLILDIHV